METIDFSRGRRITIRPGMNLVWEITVDYGDIWYTEILRSLDYEEVRDYAVRKAEKLGWTDREDAE